MLLKILNANPNTWVALENSEKIFLSVAQSSLVYIWVLLCLCHASLPCVCVFSYDVRVQSILIWLKGKGFGNIERFFAKDIFYRSSSYKWLHLWYTMTQELFRGITHMNAFILLMIKRNSKLPKTFYHWWGNECTSCVPLMAENNPIISHECQRKKYFVFWYGAENSSLKV